MNRCGRVNAKKARQREPTSLRSSSCNEPHQQAPEGQCPEHCVD